jgi:hypothetical protein
MRCGIRHASNGARDLKLEKKDRLADAGQGGRHHHPGCRGHQRRPAEPRASGAVVTLMERSNVETVIVAGRCASGVASFWAMSSSSFDPSLSESRDRIFARRASRTTSSRTLRGGPDMLLPTSLVGSYAQPEWLIDRKKLAGRFPPRTRAKELWRIPPRTCWRKRGTMPRSMPCMSRRRRPRHHHRWRDPARELFQPLCHRTGWRGHGQPGHRARPLGPPEPGAARGRPDQPPPCGAGARCEFLKRTRSKAIKITVPGPFTMAQQAQDDYYGEEALAMAYAGAVNEEIKDLFAAGADVVQLDEPYMQARPDKARAYGLKALNARWKACGHHGAAHLLRLRRDHPRAARGLFLPARTVGQRRCSRCPSKPRSRA